MDVAQTYRVAREASKRWRNTSVKERLIYFRTLRSLLVDQASDIADLLHEVTGKPRFEALTAEVLTVIDTIAYWEKHALRQLKPQAISTPKLLFGRRSWVEYRPRGVVLVIAPWNYPFQLTLIPTLSALLAGNAVVLKPSEVTNKLDYFLQELFSQAEFPSGLVQVVSGGSKTGADLVESSPDLIFFTGSVKTGKTIQKVAANNLIPTILELGGKDSMIVLKDANLERSIQGALWGGYTNCGQVCLATERIFVQKEIYESFLNGFVQAVKQLSTGQLTSLEQVQVVKTQIEDALGKGASLVAGAPPEKWEKKSLKIRPLVLVDVNDDMIITHEETFGPVVSVIPFSTLEEAVCLANRTTYGLGASVWSRDLNKAKTVARELVAGNICINDTMVTVANPYLPFGGLKASGFGSYHGERGLQVFCTEIALMESKGKKNRELNWFPYNLEKEELVLELLGTLYGSKKKWWRVLKKAIHSKNWF